MDDCKLGAQIRELVVAAWIKRRHKGEAQLVAQIITWPEASEYLTFLAPLIQREIFQDLTECSLLTPEHIACLHRKLSPAAWAATGLKVEPHVQLLYQKNWQKITSGTEPNDIWLPIDGFTNNARAYIIAHSKELLGIDLNERANEKLRKLDEHLCKKGFGDYPGTVRAKIRELME